MVMKARHISAIITVVLLAASTGQAGMTFMSGGDGECAVAMPSFVSVESGCLGVSDLSGIAPGSLSIVTDEAAEEADAAQAAQITSDNQNSLHLCVYALLSMGLCRSAPYVKKFSLGIVPQWYHDGGPFQIGHSQAISPDCLDSAPVYCFIQPDVAANNPMPKYRLGSVVSLWRTSQFTPTTLASRGPPYMS